MYEYLETFFVNPFQPSDAMWRQMKSMTPLGITGLERVNFFRPLILQLISCNTFYILIQPYFRSQAD
jgi:hypothetical protein